MIECRVALFILGGCLPVVAEWAAPNSKIKLKMRLISMSAAMALGPWKDWEDTRNKNRYRQFDLQSP